MILGQSQAAAQTLVDSRKRRKCQHGVQRVACKNLDKLQMQNSTTTKLAAEVIIHIYKTSLIATFFHQKK